MNENDRNRKNMVDTTDNWLTDNTSQLEMLPRFTETKTALELKVEEANAAAKDADEGGGESEKKLAAKELLIKTTREALKPVVLMATFTDDIELLNKVEITKSTLNKMSGQQLVIRCNVALSLINAHDATADGQTPEKIADLDQAITAYKAVATAPRKSIAERKEANARFSDCVDDAVALLNSKMDKVMDMIEYTNPQLYNEYEAVRIIVG